MMILTFVNTNKGVVAIRRHQNAENRYYTQVWMRCGGGEWKKRHFQTKDGDGEISPGLLEALYRGAEKEGLPYEDWW